MAKIDLVKPEDLHDILRYDALTGLLFWRERHIDLFPSETAWKIFNSRFAGTKALNAVSRFGYKYGCIFYKKYYSHRVIWAMEYGEWPEYIDHINGIRTDNRINNLRNVTVKQNQRNQKKRADNKSGHTGVSWDLSRNKWMAHICDNGFKNLGRFDNISDAIDARKNAEKKLGYHKNHGTDR